MTIESTSNGVSESESSNGHASAAAAKELGREQRELECVLNDDELRARGDEMATAELEQDKLKEQRKGINGEIANLRASCAKLAEAIDSRSERRMVACVWIEEPGNATAKRLVRQDTGATIDTRAMESDELQVGLGFCDATPANDNGEGPEPEVETVIDDATGEVMTGAEAYALEAASKAAVAPTTRKASKKQASKTPKNKPKAKGKPSKHTRHVHA